jgi:hypothetical protein
MCLGHTRALDRVRVALWVAPDPGMQKHEFLDPDDEPHHDRYQRNDADATHSSLTSILQQILNSEARKVGVGRAWWQAHSEMMGRGRITA